MHDKTGKRRKFSTRIATAAAMLLAVPAVVIGVTSGQYEAEAASCLDTDNRQQITKAAGSHYAPGGSWLTTTSNCADINLSLGWGVQDRQVKVCFQSGGCQGSYTVAKSDMWNVIAANVKTGTKYKFYFTSSSPKIGASVAD
jgi:hypothetical protein